ncbi:hypothetical protein AMJ74_00930 [candidate division WOR_3 bacterium SM1_77]|jgi:hypothetical protein|uniref:Uncharacterized protein n=1 Tax=candidate division WOR_3 bacterium SM1_77 TaxID=1703778 RepID=A0A0S8K2A3_UNCW3|nr:MAG: hypothetical protein AMJ74_00930 [candidate division WOR_3 bacterium SM1_77]
MRRMPLFLFIVSAFLHPCFAEFDWARLILRESTNDQASATGILKKELYDLQYDSQMRVGDFLRTHPNLETLIIEFLKHPKIDQHYLTDGTIEYGYQLPLIGGIIREILPAAQPIQLVVPMLCPTCDQPWPGDKRLPEGITLIPRENEVSDFSGIIIDCRGFTLTPCLFPKILNETLVDVYSSNFADPHNLILRGLVAYYSDEMQAKSRIGENPLLIKALGVTGEKPTDIKISSVDAQRIHSSQNKLNLLRECRVAIVFGQ